ncbi:MAG: hypothetical protein ACE5D7_00870 [Fidelibacterota bacterium]
MTKDEQAYLREIKTMMKEDRDVRLHLVKDVSDIKVALVGKPDDPNDLGLQGMVSENTKFRHNVSRGLWMLLVSAVGAVVAKIKGYL